MLDLSVFIRRIKKWTPDKRNAQKAIIQEKKRKLETRRRDLQAQIDALAIQLDALYTVDANHDIPDVSDYKYKLHISDHAMVRYLDRVVKFNTDLIRQEFIKMMPDSIPRNTSTLIVNNMVYQLVWLPNQIVVKTFYKRRKKSKEAAV